MLKQTAWERHCFLPEQNPTKIDRETPYQTWLLFGTQHRSLIFLCTTQRDPIGRHVASWRIWLVDCSVTYLVANFAELFRSAKSGQKSCFERIVLDGPYLGQFLSDFVRIMSLPSRENSSGTRCLHFSPTGGEYQPMVSWIFQFKPNKKISVWIRYPSRHCYVYSTLIQRTYGT